jgi:hypothetical protein
VPVEKEIDKADDVHNIGVIGDNHGSVVETIHV